MSVRKYLMVLVIIVLALAAVAPMAAFAEDLPTVPPIDEPGDGGSGGVTPLDCQPSPAANGKGVMGGNPHTPDLSQLMAARALDRLQQKLATTDSSKHCHPIIMGIVQNIR